jgi:hypothetical protein
MTEPRDQAVVGDVLDTMRTSKLLYDVTPVEESMSIR